MKTRAALAGAVACVVWLLAPAADATLPAAEKILLAVARANRAAGRGQALIVPVSLFFDAAESPVATGTLLADPSGRVRMELRSRAGFVERHLLRAGRTRATRDGSPIEDPRPFLPPLHLLQARSADAFAAGVAGLGVRTDEVGLRYAGAHDCYVFGRRAAEAASVWVDQESLEVVRVERADGVRFDWGPTDPEAEVRVPAWVEIREPGKRSARLVFGPAAPIRPAPDDFRPQWLESP